MTEASVLNGPRRPPPYHCITEKQAEQWRRDGYFLLKDVIPKSAIAALLADADALEAAREQQLRDQHEGHFLINRAGEITFTIHIVKQSLAARRFVFQSPLVDLCRDLIGPSARLYWDQLVYKKPEKSSGISLASRQWLHVCAARKLPHLLDSADAGNP